ncbi:MAG: hypothetical protein DPW19_05025 [cyanobacterium CYA1]|nr:hypothetical protein [cyanobacterium CYA1]
MVHPCRLDQPLQMEWVVVQITRGDQRAWGFDHVDRPAAATGVAVGFRAPLEEAADRVRVLEVGSAEDR